MYNYKCEYCEGTVKEKRLKQEVFKQKDGFLILEDVPVGVCDTCGYKYYNASILRRVRDVVKDGETPLRQESIPVYHG